MAICPGLPGLASIRKV